MAAQSLAVQDFIAQAFQTKRVKEIIADWSVDPVDLAVILENELYEMGIYRVLPQHYQEFILESIIFRLRHSEEIGALRLKADIALQKRNQDRRKP